MCGIAGIVSNKDIIDKDWLEKASSKIIHRGPDSFGYWWADSGNIGFAHRRLSIIDLSSNGHQPMLDKGKNIVITYNGEIYNFKELRSELIKQGYIFFSKTDTEVIINSYKHWGVNCFDKFDGMFAIALFDKRSNKFYLVRDRVGEKPIFFSHDNNEFRFCSEMKGLLSDTSKNFRINKDALDCYLTLGFVPGKICLVDGINKLEPASILELDVLTQKKKVTKYWYPYKEKNKILNNIGPATLRLENILSTSVERQLFADVQVGILLSGGIDSSLITALASRFSNKIKTFNVKFSDNPNYDESLHAREIANHFSTDHYELNADSISTDLLSKLSFQFDEPICDSSMLPTYLVTELVSQHCKVALGGDGGDELFGGYHHYSRILKLKKYTRHVPLLFRKKISNISTDILPIGFKGRNWLQSAGIDFEQDVPQISTFFDLKYKNQFYDKINFNSNYAINLRNQYINPNINFPERAMNLDFYNYLPEDILVKVDRTSMLNSLELRSPMLGRQVIEFANSLHSDLKVTESHKKIILKELCKKILPKNFNTTRKQGFSIPLHNWLKKGKWLEYFKSILLDHESSFNKKTINNLFELQKRGYSNSERLFSLVLLELWKKNYNINF